MKKSSEYRQHARECRELAARMAAPKDRQPLLRMAEHWEQLADESERTVRLRELTSPDLADPD